MMNDIDVNAILTETEINKSREAFHAFDIDGSGTIDRDELRKVLEGTITNS